MLSFEAHTLNPHPQPGPLCQVVVAFGWALAAGYACMGLSAHSVSGFLVAVAPIWTCTGVIDTIVTAQLTKVGPCFLTRASSTGLALKSCWYPECLSRSTG